MTEGAAAMEAIFAAQQKMGKLSGLQKQMLVILFDLHQEQREFPDTSVWGVAWQPAKQWPAMNRADGAALSRAIARLESRGLLIRQNIRNGTPESGRRRDTPQSMPPLRCDHILLTEAGHAAARLIKTQPKTKAIRAKKTVK